MEDYAFIKDHSESLKVIKFEVSALTEYVVRSLDATIIEAGKETCAENECKLLIYIINNGVNSGAKTITVEKMQFIHSSIEKNVSEETSIIWSV